MAGGAKPPAPIAPERAVDLAELATMELMELGWADADIEAALQRGAGWAEGVVAKAIEPETADGVVDLNAERRRRS